jgi:hypothetical protein
MVAEIKSAIELAMEKTKGLHLSREEKEKLQVEELHSKARSLVNRFLEVDFHLREVEKELSKCNPQQREELEKLIVQYLTAGIELDRDNDLIFQGIESFQEKTKSIIKKIRELIEGYQKRKQKEYHKTERDLLTKLERQGISGSAVQVKIEGSREWEEATAKFRPTFEAQLLALKKELGSI